jgi:hypothetical protein
MFNTRLMEVNEGRSATLGNPQDSFSSGSDHEDANGLKRSTNYRQIHHHHHQRKRSKPQRAIPRAFAVTGEQKAKAGIFVVDPFHCRVNVEFLKAFAQYHGNRPQFSKSESYFSSSGDEDDEAAFAELNNTLAPDMSHMGFTTSSSGSDDDSHFNNSDPWDAPIPTRKGRSSSSSAGSNNKPTSKKAKSSGFTGVSSSKIVNSSSIPRAADNSENFPEKLSETDIEKLVAKIRSNYKNFPVNSRHGSTPMDISTCPGVKLLSEEEYTACSLLRIRPALFFHARSTLLHNFHHSVGYFRKSAAQKMLRIDVNKTGKLYDFLVKQNWLPQTENGQCKAEPEKIVVDDPETYHQL